MHRTIISSALAVVATLVLTSGAFAQGHNHGAMSMPSANTKAKPSTFVTPPAFKSQLDSVYIDYLSLQSSLSGDEFKSVKPNAQALVRSLGKVDMKLLTDGKTHMAWMEVSKSLAQLAWQVAETPDIESARTAFRALSEAVITTAKQFGAPDITLYVFHCPMALNKTGADWVQAEKTTKNPYFGKTMLTCGKITETFVGGNVR